MLRRLTVWSGLLGALVCSPLSAQEYGNLKGQFIYDGQAPAPEAIKLLPGVAPECAAHKPMEESLLVGSDGGIANVVVFIQPKTVGQKITPHPDYAKTAADEVVLDNHQCRFEPRVLAMRAGQKLKIKNSDDFGHNTKGDPFANTPFNPVIAAGGSVDKTLPKPEKLPFQVSCNIHPFMRGFLVVRPDPYFAVSAPDGTFSIEKIPAGTYDLVFWHERQGYVKEATIGGAKTELRKGAKILYSRAIKAGDADLGQIKIDPELLKKKTT